MKDGYIFQSIFDGVDAIIATDETLYDKLEEMAEEAKYGIDSTMPIREAMEEVTMYDENAIGFSLLDEDADLNDINLDTDPSVSQITPYDMNAEDYIEAYQDLSNGAAMGVGDMIDLLVDTI